MLWCRIRLRGMRFVRRLMLWSVAVLRREASGDALAVRFHAWQAAVPELTVLASQSPRMPEAGTRVGQLDQLAKVGCRRLGICSLGRSLRRDGVISSCRLFRMQRSRLLWCGLLFCLRCGRLWWLRRSDLADGDFVRARAGWEEFYIPTHRDETAMNGAPDRLWLVGDDNGNNEQRHLDNRQRHATR